MSMKSMTMMPPMSRSRSWRTTSFTASRLFFDDRVLEPLGRRLRAGADEAAGVDVDDGERLRVVEDEVAARRAGRPAGRGSRRSPSRRRIVRTAAPSPCPVDALDHVRRGLLEVADDPLVRPVVVDVGRDEVAGEQVTHDPKRKLGLLVDEVGCASPNSPAPGSSSRAAGGRRGRARCPPPRRPRRRCGR